MIRDRHSLYRELADDSIENLYTLKLNNKDNKSHTFHLSVSSENISQLSVRPDRIELNANESRAVTVSVRTPPLDDKHDIAGKLHRINAIEFTVTAEDNPHLISHHSASFLAGDHE